MSVLVLVEHDGKSVRDATLATVTAASKLGDVHALVAGSNVGSVADAFQYGMRRSRHNWRRQAFHPAANIGVNSAGSFETWLRSG